MDLEKWIITYYKQKDIFIGNIDSIRVNEFIEILNKDRSRLLVYPLGNFELEKITNYPLSSPVFTMLVKIFINSSDSSMSV